MSIDALAPLDRSAEESLENLTQYPTTKPFDSVNMRFLKALRQKLTAPHNKAFPELVALGFWLRRFESMLEKSVADSEHSRYRLALGTVVHFTPSNVDTMFVYSWICGLVMGNRNLVRVASAHSHIQEKFFVYLNELFENVEFEAVSRRNLFVKFARDSKWSSQLCLFADARVLWGGDESVNSIRQLATKPRARDISFADRYSVSAINGDRLDPDLISTIAQNFWRDIEQYQQQACSSPKVVFWQGDKQCLQIFTQSLAKNAHQQVSDSKNLRNEQLVTAQRVVAQYGGHYTFSGQLCFIMPDAFEPRLLQLHAGFMCLIIVEVSSLTEVHKALDEKVQTVTHWGFSTDELEHWSATNPHNGIDRIVPIGRALAFDHVWDGFDLLESLSRHVTIINNS